MLLHRWNQRLDDKDVAFPAIGLELHAKAIVRIALDLRWQQRNIEVGADFRRQKRMRATSKDSDFGQRSPPQGGCARGDKHLSDDVESRIITGALYRFARQQAQRIVAGHLSGCWNERSNPSGDVSGTLLERALLLKALYPSR